MQIHFRAIRSSGTPYCPITALVLSACLALGGCGGSDGAAPAPVAKRNLHAERDVTTSDIADVQQCLGNLHKQFAQQTPVGAMSLTCLEGTFRGLTADGSTCALQVDAQTDVFHFDYGRESVTMRREIVLRPPDALAVFNLEDASAQDRAGILLTRFTGGVEPLTESVAIRAGAGRTAAALPTVTYQRASGERVTQTECRFGK